jgi:hypothetical protein
LAILQLQSYHIGHIYSQSCLSVHWERVVFLTPQKSAISMHTANKFTTQRKAHSNKLSALENTEFPKSVRPGILLLFFFYFERVIGVYIPFKRRIKKRTKSHFNKLLRPLFALAFYIPLHLESSPS